MSILKAEKLSRNFGGLMAINDVSFSVEAGERHAIIGPNGAGKTTLFNLLSGELPPSQGKTFLDGREITNLPSYKRAQLGVGRTFQRNNLFFDLSVKENAQLAIQAIQGIGHRVLTPVERFPSLATETMELLSHFGLHPRVDVPARNLSYGEQRQLEVALALAIRPRILLLDEPTAGMSVAETKVITNMINDLPKDITLLIIEHDMDVVFNIADRITVLHYGQVIANGVAEDVRDDPRVMEVYLGSGSEW